MQLQSVYIMKQVFISSTLSLTYRLLFGSLVILLSISCIDVQYLTGTMRSTATGALFNQGEDSFQTYTVKSQAIGPNMIFMEGGMIVMGTMAERSPHDPNPYKERTVSLASFFVAKTVTTNIEWREYLHDLENNGTEEAYQKALPNEQVWKRELAFNDDLEQNYAWTPGFNKYPAVGISWEQANDYCEWRTHAVNRILAEKAGEEYDPEEDNSHLIEAGIIVAGYRQLTEAEYERTARGLSKQENGILQASQRAYAWEGLSLRGETGPYKGKFLANFKRGPGHYKGLPGENNSNGATCSVYDYPPTEEGVYIGHGNVREWVQDVYRPLSSQDVEDFNPVRRNDILDPESDYDSKNHNSLIDNDSHVIKGFAWKDCGYWAQVSTRRYAHKTHSDAMTGFRCAMTSVGR